MDGGETSKKTQSKCIKQKKRCVGRHEDRKEQEKFSGRNVIRII